MTAYERGSSRSYAVGISTGSGNVHRHVDSPSPHGARAACNHGCATEALRRGPSRASQCVATRSQRC